MNCSGGGSAALAVGRRYGLIPVVWRNEDCNPEACFYIDSEDYFGIKKTITKVIKINKKRYILLSKKNQKISNENSSFSYNNKLSRIFKKLH